MLVMPVLDLSRAVPSSARDPNAAPASSRKQAEDASRIPGSSSRLGVNLPFTIGLYGAAVPWSMRLWESVRFSAERPQDSNGRMD
jgi:hypothetical protein